MKCDRLVHGRIPNFRNNPDCSTNLAQLEEFQRARVIEICPSLAQEHLRLFALAEGKTMENKDQFFGHSDSFSLFF